MRGERVPNNNAVANENDCISLPLALSFSLTRLCEWVFRVSTAAARCCHRREMPAAFYIVFWLETETKRHPTTTTTTKKDAANILQKINKYPWIRGFLCLCLSIQCYSTDLMCLCLCARWRARFVWCCFVLLFSIPLWRSTLCKWHFRNRCENIPTISKFDFFFLICFATAFVLTTMKAKIVISFFQISTHYSNYAPHVNHFFAHQSLHGVAAGGLAGTHSA